MCPDSVDRGDALHRAELSNWFERQSCRYFTRQEIHLQCVVALHYADPSRPTARELWHRLHHFILEDARLLKSGPPQRLPSFSTFRSRIADLPRDFVWQARSGRDFVRPSIAALVSRFEIALPHTY
jgi:hypothetical protein